MQTVDIWATLDDFQLWTFEPRTPTGRRWIVRNHKGYDRWGDALLVKAGRAAQLVDRMRGDGLCVTCTPPEAEAVDLADGPALQGLVPGVAPVSATARAIAARQASKAARRGAGPLPAGGLFDETAREQQDLFG